MFLYEDEPVLAIIDATYDQTPISKLISMCKDVYDHLLEHMVDINNIASAERRISEKTKFMLYTEADLRVIRSVLDSIKSATANTNPVYDRSIAGKNVYWIDKSVIRTFLAIDDAYSNVTEDRPEINMGKLANDLHHIQVGSMPMIQGTNGTRYPQLSTLIIELIVALQADNFYAAYAKYEELNNEVLRMVYGNE